MSMSRSLDSILLRLETTPRRVVSLVPSYTESLFDLGFGNCVAGVTDYCTSPAVMPAHIRRVGGPKTPDLEAIRALRPDLVIANQEENTPEGVLGLEEMGIPVWLSFPRSVQEVLDVLWGMVDLFSDRAASLKVRTLEDSVDWLLQTSDTVTQVCYFCPIWQGITPEGVNWWMTFNRETYSSDLLGLFGGVNIFADRKRSYPLEADLGLCPAEPEGERDTRYPRVRLEEIIAADPEMILLPDEPFPFDDRAQMGLMDALRDTTATRTERVYSLDGSLITWYGTRLGRALDELPGYFLDQS